MSIPAAIAMLLVFWLFCPVPVPFIIPVVVLLLAGIVEFIVVSVEFAISDDIGIVPLRAVLVELVVALAGPIDVKKDDTGGAKVVPPLIPLMVITFCADVFANDIATNVGLD